MKRHQRSLPTRKLAVESLEDRTLLDASLTAGVLEVGGTDGADRIVVKLEGDELQIVMNGTAQSFNIAEVEKIRVLALGGNDRVSIEDDVAVPTEIEGGSGNDRLNGGPGDDDIQGGDGRDVIHGNSGDDDIFGDDHNDRLYGEDGDDSLHGGAGKDSEYGGMDDDDLFGDDGRDILNGEQGSDSLYREATDRVLDSEMRDELHSHDEIPSHDESELKARLTGVTDAIGLAKYEEEQEAAGLKREFEIVLFNAVPNSTFDVLLDGFLIGQVQTNALGFGKLEYSSQPDDSDEHPFPVDFPVIAAGSVVSVGAVVEGSFGVEVEDDIEDGDDDGDTGGDDGNSESELKAVLTGVAGAFGQVEFKTEQNDSGGTAREFELELRGLTPDSVLDVAVGGVVIGQVTVNAFGRAKMKFSSSPDDPNEGPFPDTFPPVLAGSTISVGNVLAGTFA